MSAATGDPTGPGGPPPTEEELRAAYEAEIKKIRVEHVLLEHVVTLVNLGMRRTGMVSGTESERDPGQVKLAIEAVRSLLPLLEQAAPQQVGPIRDALSQLQLAYVRIGGSPAEGAEAGPPAGGGETAGGGAAGGGAAGGGAAGGGAAGGPGAAGAQEKPGPAAEPGGEEPQGPGPAQRSGRLWVPGQ